MPLLPPEISLFPENLLDMDPAGEEIGQGRWWVLHSRPRAEKSLARSAHEENIGFFLPTFTRQWRKSGRKFSAHLPLFPGYLFAFGPPDIRDKMLATRLVANFLSVPDQNRLWADLRRVHALMYAGLPLTPEDRLTPGTRVGIIEGPLKGFEGVVIRNGHKWKLIIEVEFIQRGISVEVETWMVQPITENKIMSDASNC